MVMRVFLYPKLVAETSVEVTVTWPANVVRTMRRRILTALTSRPGWSLIRVHYHDDTGAYDAAS